MKEGVPIPKEEIKNELPNDPMLENAEDKIGRIPAEMVKLVMANFEKDEKRGVSEGLNPLERSILDLAMTIDKKSVLEFINYETDTEKYNGGPKDKWPDAARTIMFEYKKKQS